MKVKVVDKLELAKIVEAEDLAGRFDSQKRLFASRLLTLALALEAEEKK